MRERLTFANVVSCIALFIALGGSAVALKANSVGSHQIRNDSVRGQDVRNGSLKGKDLAAGSVGERELAPTPSDPNSIQMGSDLGTCDPSSAAYVQCAKVVLNLEEPSRLMLTAGGGQAGDAGAAGQLSVLPWTTRRYWQQLLPASGTSTHVTSSRRMASP